MITVRHLIKQYGPKRAVDDLSFEVKPGVVTGFLGPNGAGKSTTMRAIMGLDRPTSGEALVGGKQLAQFPAPLHQVGALLEARAIHPGRSARDHLLAIAATNGIPRSRVDYMLEVVGLTTVARKHAGAFSLGMGQRLGIATALLGDPEVVILDEPVNGLDPDGVVWIRNLMKQLAAEGRTVFVSSHLISEMALTAEHLVIIGRGRLIADTSVQALEDQTRPETVLVRSSRPRELRRMLCDANVKVTDADDGALEVHQLTAARIGDLALAHRIPIHELTPQRQSLEDAYMRLTHEAVEYQPTQGRPTGTGEQES